MCVCVCVCLFVVCVCVWGGCVYLCVCVCVCVCGVCVCVFRREGGGFLAAACATFCGDVNTERLKWRSVVRVFIIII